MRERAPRARDATSLTAQLSKARAAFRRCVDAILVEQRGPLWVVLAQACDRAETLGLDDHAFQTFCKNVLTRRTRMWSSRNSSPSSSRALGRDSQ